MKPWVLICLKLTYSVILNKLLHLWIFQWTGLSILLVVSATLFSFWIHPAQLFLHHNCWIHVGSLGLVKDKYKPDLISLGEINYLSNVPSQSRVAIGRCSRSYINGKGIQISATIHFPPGSLLIQLNIHLVLKLGFTGSGMWFLIHIDRYWKSQNRKVECVEPSQSDSVLKRMLHQG